MDWSRFNELVQAINAESLSEPLNELREMAASETVPDDKVVILHAMSTAYSRQNQFRKAKSSLRQAIDILGTQSESYPRISLSLAVVSIDEENWNEALKILDNILEQHAAILQLHDNKDSLEEVQRNRGFALFELNRPKEALPLLMGVRSEEYKRARTLYSIAACNIQLGNFDAAISDFEELLALNPGSAYSSYAHYNVGRIHYGRLQLARAKHEFEKCLAYPDRGNISDKEILQALVFCCEGLNLEQEAARYKEMMKRISGRKKNLKR